MKIWNIQSLETIPSVDGKTDVVKFVNWTVDLFEDGNSVNLYGRTELDPPKKNFTNFEDLTEDQVLKWTKAKINLQEIDNSLAGKMTQRKNPPIIKQSVPWNRIKSPIYVSAEINAEGSSGSQAAGDQETRPIEDPAPVE